MLVRFRIARQSALDDRSSTASRATDATPAFLGEQKYDLAGACLIRLTLAHAWDDLGKSRRRPRTTERRLPQIVQTSSVVQHRRRGCSRRRSGSRRAPAARPAVDCFFAPGAVTSAARIASLHHACRSHRGLMAALLSDRQCRPFSVASAPSGRRWRFRITRIRHPSARSRVSSALGERSRSSSASAMRG